MMTGGVGLYATMNALIATAASAPWLLAWRSMAGFGGGAMIISERIYIAQAAAGAARVLERHHLGRPVRGIGGGAGGRQRRGGHRRPARTVRARRPDERDRLRRHALPAVAAGDAAASRCGRCRRRPSRSRSGARRAAGRQHRAAGELRRVHHHLRADGDRPPRMVDRGRRHRVLVLRRRQHRARAVAGAPGRPRRAAPDRARCPAPACGASRSGWSRACPSPPSFALAFLAGGGLTAFSASWYALLADTAGERRLSRTFGIISAASTIGIVIGALAAAELWTRIDIAAGMLLAALTAAGRVRWRCSPSGRARYPPPHEPDPGRRLDLDACVEHLRALIRIPSVNPPDGGPDVAAGRDPAGGETAAARYCAEVLDDAGIAAEVIELIARPRIVRRAPARDRPGHRAAAHPAQPPRRRAGRRGVVVARPVRRRPGRRRGVGSRRGRHEGHGRDGAGRDARPASGPARSCGATSSSPRSPTRRPAASTALAASSSSGPSSSTMRRAGRGGRPQRGRRVLDHRRRSSLLHDPGRREGDRLDAAAHDRRRPAMARCRTPTTPPSSWPPR